MANIIPTPEAPPPGDRKPASRQARSVARLAAVQALYQLEVSGAGTETVVREFSDHRFDGDIEGEPLAEADEGFFGEIVRGVVEAQTEIDRAITRRLAANWRLDRIDATARAILRCGAYELIRRPEVPTEVVIDEYVEITKSFFEGPEPGFVNGCLDALARDERP
jgi:N utilization substance protein B